MAVISEQFSIEGVNYKPPKEWQDLRENISFGQISNQPIVDTERFTFIGNAARRLYDHYKDGKIMSGLDTAFSVTQRDIITDIFKDRHIDLTECEFINPDFNNEFTPLEVVASVKYKRGITDLQTELRGLTWGYLDYIGAVGSADYTTVKTAVQKLYNGIDIALAIITLYVIQLQLRNLIDQSSEDIEAFRDKVSGSTNPGAKISGVIYIIVITALRAAAAIILLASLVSTVLDLIALLVPPIVNNKGITWRRALEIIFEQFGYGFVSDFPELDIEVLLPSKVEELDANFVKNLIPTFDANEKGYPSSSDSGYLASGLVEEARKRFNARLDIIGENVVMRWENDPDLFLESGFTPEVDIKRETVKPNVSQIPNTRLISFQVDNSDEYTTKYYKGTSYEVINVVTERDRKKRISFKGLERHDIGFALGSNKTSLTNIEKIMVSVAKVADELGNFLGKDPKLETRIKKNRTNVLRVSTNNHAVAKLVPVNGGNMPRNHREITSARRIENKYYYNRSIVRGNGQKLIEPNFKTPFNLKDREAVLKNGNFITSSGQQATIVNLEYRQFADMAEGEIQVDFDYIAKGTVQEIVIEPDK
jgi:hypothetical protein